MSTETRSPNQPTVPDTSPTGTSNRRWTRGGARPRPGNAFELFSWYYFRVSGILLLFFALGHLVIMHLLNNVDVIDYTWVSNRWASPFWRTFDIILLVLALSHGLNGVRVLIYDYIHSRGWRTFALSAMYTIGLLFLLIGAQVIISFQPQIQNIANK
ncbi:MAG TPA: succinate dehydrogenase hydrophobic membrane anchor subunit [Chloroflexia bacterium]|nr:succinate dehydrogenase hydrophobic membrane anchor subunit [Chloroflexia bacterium]